MSLPVTAEGRKKSETPIEVDPMPEDVAIRVTDVWKRYRSGAYQGKTLVKEMQSFLARISGKEDPNQKIAMDRSQLDTTHAKDNEWFWAVRGVNFEVKKGETVVILGRNGAGKSTILQMLCQITSADRGNIEFRGRFATLLQAGVGFHEELTGLENIFLNGAILGLTRDEITERIPAIAEFSEIPQFLDTPVKRYSSGMRGRLGFSVAAHLGAEIMILDEVFATGDRVFRKKCIEKIKELSRTGTTILLVTHLVEMLGDAVDRAIYMENGRVRYDGEKRKAIDYYLGYEKLPEDEESETGVDAMSGGLYVDPTEGEEDGELEMERIACRSRISSNPVEPSLHIELGEIFARETLPSAPEKAASCFNNALVLAEIAGDTVIAEKAMKLLGELESRLPVENEIPYFLSSVAKRSFVALRGWLSGCEDEPFVLSVQPFGPLFRFSEGLRLLQVDSSIDGLSYEDYLAALPKSPDCILALGAKAAPGEETAEWVRRLLDMGCGSVALWVNRMSRERYKLNVSLIRAAEGKIRKGASATREEEMERYWKLWARMEELELLLTDERFESDSSTVYGSVADELSSVSWRILRSAENKRVEESMNLVLNGSWSDECQGMYSIVEPLGDVFYVQPVRKETE